MEAVRRTVGARTVRPAHPDLVNAATEYAANLVCPLLLPDTMPLLVDHRLVDGLNSDDVVYTATGEASTALGIRGAPLRPVPREAGRPAPPPPVPAPTAPRRPPARGPDRRARPDAGEPQALGHSQ